MAVPAHGAVLGTGDMSMALMVTLPLLKMVLQVIHGLQEPVSMP